MMMDGRIRERRRRQNKGRALRVDDFFFSLLRGLHVTCRKTDPVFHGRKDFSLPELLQSLSLEYGEDLQSFPCSLFCLLFY